MNKKTFLISLLPFVILMVLSIALSRWDDRPSDGNLTYGFPFDVYYKTAGYGAPEASGFEPFGFVLDALFFYGISLAGSYTFFSLRKK